MTAWRAIRPHPAIARPVAALAVAVWLLVGSVVFLVVQQRDTQRRVATIEAFEKSCLSAAADTPRCDELYDSLIASLSSAQLRQLNLRIERAVSSQ